MSNIYSKSQFPTIADDLEEGQVLPRNASNNWNNESVSLIESLQVDSEPAWEGNTPDWQKSGGRAASESKRGQRQVLTASIQEKKRLPITKLIQTPEETSTGSSGVWERWDNKLCQRLMGPSQSCIDGCLLYLNMAEYRCRLGSHSI